MTISKSGLEIETKGKMNETEGKFRGDLGKAAGGMNRRTFLIGAAASASCARGARLNVYNWSDYIAPDTVSNFEREFGARVRYGTYESNQEMLAQVMSGNSGWDVVFPSEDFIEPMCELGLLAPLRHEWLPNLDALDPAFAPGTEIPSSGGMSARQALELLKAVIAGSHAVGLDVVEVSPPFDHSDITSFAALKLIFEFWGMAWRGNS